jgi:hypothetical protein
MMRLFSRWIVVFSLAVSLSPLSTLAATGKSYPVQWTHQLKLQSIKDIPNLLASPTYVNTQVKFITDNRAQHAIAKTCNDYFHLTKKGYVAETNIELSAESWFIANCDPLIYLLHAKPAKFSQVRGFNIQKEYGLLPAKLIFPNMGSDPQPRGTLQKAFPHARVVATTPTSITLDSKKAGMKTSISVLAWGDFNGSGYDQMLVFIANYALQGTYHSYTPYVLTRTTAKAPLTVVKLPGQK